MVILRVPHLPTQTIEGAPDLCSGRLTEAKEFARSVVDVRGVREVRGDVRVDRDDALSGLLRGSLGCALKMPRWASAAHV
jgi:hypothetical protein